MSNTRTTAQKGCDLIMPWLRTHGRVLDTNRFRSGRVRELQQRTVGDYIIAQESDALFTVEVKSEEAWTGNLYLETWSNRCPDENYRRDGWLLTLEADRIVFVFLDAGKAVVANLPALRNWMLDPTSNHTFREKPPRRSVNGEQKNWTMGYLVPVEAVVHSVGAKCLQLIDGAWRELPLPVTDSQYDQAA